MATVLVTGGTGTLGAHVVRHLAEAGHEARILSRRPGPQHWQGDLATGQGLAAALEGATRVVHTASDTRRFGRQDLVQTQNLLETAREARTVEHLLYVSIVGIDHIPYAYYRRKLECEGAVEASPLPTTILRATQFHELIAMVLGALSRSPVAPVPARFRFQTVAAEEVGRRVAETVIGPSLGRAPDLGGPEVLDLGDMAAAWKARFGRPRSFVRLPVPGAVGRGFREGLNTCPDHRDGVQTWAEFVRALPGER